jgi:hypothetical protein
MPIVATPARRQLAMAVLLLLAVSGAVIRKFAPQPSVLHDIGTLLLVMWLPAVGNLIAYLVRRIPRKAKAAPDFAAGSAFVADLRVQVQVLGLPQELASALTPQERRITVLAGQHGFSARLDVPVLQALAQPGEQALSLQLLRPELAGELPPGTEVHLVVGRTAAATARVL